MPLSAAIRGMSCSVRVAFLITLLQSLLPGFCEPYPTEGSHGSLELHVLRAKVRGRLRSATAVGCKPCARLSPAASSSLPGGGAGDIPPLSQSLFKSCFSISLPLEEGLVYRESSSYGGDGAPSKIGAASCSYSVQTSGGREGGRQKGRAAGAGSPDSEKA